MRTMNSKRMLMSAAAAVLMGLGFSGQAAEQTWDAGEGDRALWYEKPAPACGYKDFGIVTNQQ